MSTRLSKEVLERLLNISGSRSPASIRVRIAELRRKYSGLTPHAAAQLYAEKFNKSLMYKLDNEDRQSLYQARIQGLPPRIVYIQKSRGGARRKVEYLKYSSRDGFEQKHIEEINRAYNCSCYTAVYILCRKVIENLIIRLLRKRFPSKKYESLFWDQGRGRFHDFRVILGNLTKVRGKFPGPVQKAVGRLVSKASTFSKDANDQAHSLFHIATRRELDEARVDEIFGLISEIDKVI